MTRYRIHPAEVAAVLRATEAAAAELEPLVQPTLGYAEAAVQGAGGSAVVNGALATVMTRQAAVMTRISTQISSSMTSAWHATQAYERGDEEMVQRYQRLAAQHGAR